MAISRPFLLALLGVALLGATVFAVQNARNGGADKPSPVAKQAADQAAPAPAPAPEPAQASGKLSAKDAVAAILSPGKSIDSARFSIRYDARELDGDHEHDYGSISGLFASQGGSGVPDFDIRVRSHDDTGSGANNSNVHVVIADGKPFVGGGDKMYAGRPGDVANIGKVRSSIAGSPVAKLRPFDLSRWLDNVKVVGVEKVDGIDATHVSGKVVPGDVSRDILRLIRSEAHDVGSQADVPANFQKSIKSSVDKAKFEAWVGADRVVRRMTLAVQLDVPKSLAGPGDAGRANATVDIRLNDVNNVKAVEAPSSVASETAVKGMGAKDAKNARNVLAVAGLSVDAPGGVVGGTYSFLRLARVGESTQVAKKVLRAVEQRKEVVVFFRNPKSLDDKATEESVQYLKSHTKKLVVFTDDVQNTRSYGRLVEHLGVTQAPAIVFINRRGTASLVEGYVDGPSLRQVVADAR
jgi:hypothetical protein